MNIDTVDQNDLLFKTPFRLTIAGNSGCGKTNFIESFLNNIDKIVSRKFDNIIYAYGQYQRRFERMASHNKSIVWLEGFPHDKIENYINTAGSHTLIVCDDLMDVVNKDARFTAFYIKRSHHLNVSIILTVQNLFMNGMRTVNLNTTAYILFKTVRDKNQIRTMAMQMYPTKWRNMMAIYNDCTRSV